MGKIIDFGVTQVKWNRIEDKEFDNITMELEPDKVREYRGLNEAMKNSSESYLSSVICHMFNIFLAPFPLL